MNAHLHTPGPWSYDWIYIVAPDPNGIHPDIYIAEISCEDEDDRIASPDQQDANGRLIAAAPQLLGALEDLLAAVECFADEYSICAEIADGPEAQFARTLIATVTDAAST